MLRTDLLLGDFETAVSVYRWETSELLRMEGPTAGAALVYVPEVDERGRRERAMMEAVKYRGVPECRRTIEAKSGATALIFEGAQDARPLAVVHDLPEPALRAGLVAMLATLRFVHSRGVVHGRIDRSVVLVDPSGRFWLTGWADARPASSVPPASGVMGDVSLDLRDLARAFREALLRRPWPDPEGATIHDRDPRTAAGQELIDAGVKVDRDFARVLSRLVTADPRDAYFGATDVLADVGAVDLTAFDPWECVRPIGTRREVARVMRFLDHTREPTSETVRHAASVEFVAPDGAGKSRLLAEIARVARSRDAIVLTAEGGARGVWGGVGVLARQLVQLLGRGSRTCVQHEEALRHLLCEHPSLAAPAPQPGLDGRDSLISSCTATLTELVRIAFRRAPGLLLLDDEDRLPQAARLVWRAAGQFVQAVNGGGGVLQALLVSTSTKSYPPELAAERVIVPMRTWRQRDLEKFLARAFGAPGGARDASVAVHRITGGRPGDIVGYLRDLERKGGLQREGLRWRLTAPLSALPPTAGDQAEQVRRALDSCGRDAASLVECLAVARDVSLSREALGGLCDLRGPRLAAAADAAVAGGLLEAHGAVWLIRTAAAAHKVYAAIPDDRRRILHREVLTHLLDASPDAIDPIAVHARASADPRAAAWTEQAIAKAREEGLWATALAHIDDALATVIPSRLRANATLSRLDFLLALGRIGEVIAQLTQQGIDDREWSSNSTRASLILAKAYYEARDWERVSQVMIPETSETTSHLAELRFLRAAALRHMNKPSQAAREARLARAELDEPECHAVTHARMEHEYVEAFYRRDWTTVYRTLLDKIRLARKLRDWRGVTIARVKLGNAARYFKKDTHLVQSILARAVAISRKTDVGSAARSVLHAALGYNCWSRSARRRGYRQFSKSAFYAMETGAATLAIAARIRLTAWGVSCGIVAYEDKRYIRRVFSERSTETRSAVLGVCVDLGLCLLYYALQDELEQLVRDVREERGADGRFAPLEGFALVGRMWLGESIDLPMDGLTPDTDSRRFVARIAQFGIGDLWISAIAYCALRDRSGEERWLRRLNCRAPTRLGRLTTYPGWGGICYALALALWIPIEYDSAKWSALVSTCRRFRGPLPVALEWQRVLVESREFRRTSDWHLAQAALAQSRAQLQLLGGPELGERGQRAERTWSLRFLAQDPTAISTPPSIANTCTTSSPDSGALFGPVPSSWMQLLESARRNRRAVIISTHVGDLREFAKLIVEASAHRALVIGPTCPELRGQKVASGVTQVLVTPELWAQDRARMVLEGMTPIDASSQVLALMTVTIDSFRGLGPIFNAFCEQFDGVRYELAPFCSDRDSVRTRVRSLLRSRSQSITIDDAVLGELTKYEWPGGVAELESIVEELASTQKNPIGQDCLDMIAWTARTSAARLEVSGLQRELLGTLRASGEMGISRLAKQLGKPRRTLLRYLNALIAERQVYRDGRGRAARYRLRADSACALPGSSL